MTDAVEIAIITGSGAIITGTISAISLYITARIQRKQDEIHHQIDGRMTELLEITKSSSKAEGVIQGTKDEKDKQQTQRKIKKIQGGT